MSHVYQRNEEGSILKKASLALVQRGQYQANRQSWQDS